MSRSKSGKKIHIDLKKSGNSSVVRTLKFGTRSKGKASEGKSSVEEDKAMARKGTLHKRILQSGQFGDLEGFDFGMLAEDEPSTGVVSEPEKLNRFDVQAFLHKREKDEESMKVRSMILKYANKASEGSNSRLFRMRMEEEKVEEKSNRSLRSTRSSKVKILPPGEDKICGKSQDFMNLEPACGAHGMEEEAPETPKIVKEATNLLFVGKGSKKLGSVSTKFETPVTPVTRAGSVNKSSINGKENLNTLIKDICEVYDEEYKASNEAKEESILGTPAKTMESRRALDYGIKKEAVVPVTPVKSEKKASPKKTNGKKKDAGIGQNRTLESFGFFVKKESPAAVVKEELKVMFDGVKRTELGEMKKLCEKYGVKYVEDSWKNIDNHGILVYEGEEVGKNFKVAISMARGKPIVRREWILESEKAGKLLDYKGYMWDYEVNSRKGNGFIGVP